ncbi:Tetratricopeptide repeat protein 14 [Homalodisca vitripennis]|nr:Tetratricopeptide repeat protein 14 [Homalodisca vitripennis]
MNMEMEPPSNLDSDLVTRSLNFHGQLLQKAWEAERGEGDLQKHNVNNLDFGIYSQRQKHLSFQDRGKRLKLHQFISKRANVLFDTSLIEKDKASPPASEPGHYALLPAFETFLNLDKTSRTQHFLQCLRPKDVIISSITHKANSGLSLKVLCLDGECARSVSDLNIKAFCPTSNLISAVDKKNIPRTFMLNDLVCCEVLEVIPDSEKIICGMKGVHASDHKARLGLFHSDEFPEVYNNAVILTAEECIHYCGYC